MLTSAEIFVFYSSCRCPYQSRRYAAVFKALPDENPHPSSGPRKEIDDMLNVISTDTPINVISCGNSTFFSPQTEVVSMNTVLCVVIDISLQLN